MALLLTGSAVYFELVSQQADQKFSQINTLVFTYRKETSTAALRLFP